ncbi:MAG: sulfite exporter TauE/SafE family protein [Elusimicrobia bacterium]|nr:MAG: sulfite exporter TauE/SafE family protein [Elusimicrobiota bacterium]
MEHAGVFVLIGLAAGIVSGFFGVGGGAIIVPALVYFAGFNQHRATGTSLAVLLLPVGLGAVVAYYRHGNVDMKAAGVIAVSLFAAAWASGFLANRVSGAALKLAFGVFMTLMGLYIVISNYCKLGK